MTTTAEAPVTTPVLLPARPVDLRRAARLGFWAGVTVVFVAAIGMVEEFSERDVVAGLSLGEALLLVIPFVAGLAAGRPPATLQGFEATLRGPRNLVAGVVAGLLVGAVIGVFVVLIINFDVREMFINITPALAADEAGPRLLLWGHDPVPGLSLVVCLSLVVATVGASFHLVEERWRRAAISGLSSVVAFALLQPFVAQVLRGIQEELRILTKPIDNFLYDERALTIPAAVVIAVVGFAVYANLQRPGRVPVRQRIDRLPRRPKLAADGGTLLGGLLLLAVLPPILGPGLSQVFVRAGIFILMALGLNIVLGFGGMLDLGYVAFFAVGAYTTAILTSPSDGMAVGWSFWAAVPFVVVASAAAGLFVATPVVRMRGDYLAIVTLGFGEIARLLFLSDWLTPTFGGAQGVTRIPNITLPHVDVPDLKIGGLETPTSLGGEIRGPQAFLYLVVVLIAVVAYVSYALQRSRIGRAWMAMREDESVAEAMGVNIVNAKLSAFVIGAVMAGLGGALFAANIKAIYPSSFEILVSIIILVTVIVGGMASVPGVMLGALVLVALPEMLREFEEYRLLIYGALLIFMMLRRPEGLIPSQRRAQELHEEDVAQDAWLRTEAEQSSAPADSGNGRTAG